MQNISIGLLAHNEAPRIAGTLRSLLEQDIFHQFKVEIIVVANGCSDDTADVARRIIKCNSAVWKSTGSARVEEIAAAGKANAWNKFVHEFSSANSSLLVLMDADINLLGPHLISSLVRTLRNNPQAVVCVDQPIKDIQLKKRRSILERLLLSSTPKIDPADVPLCGQLYCALSDALRKIILPVEITCEDGFLRALLLTEGFTVPESRSRIVLDASSFHSFASVSSLRELYKHEKWLVAGCIVDMLLFDHFGKVCNSEFSAMEFMKTRYQENPHWLPRIVESEVQAKGWNLLPSHWWTRRWSALKKLSWNDRLRRFPVMVFASAADWIVFWAAIRDVRRGRAFRYWGRK